MAAPQQANQTAARTWVGLCLVCTLLTIAVLVTDVCLPPPWGGMASSQPWAVGGVMLLINSLSLLLLGCWLIHFLHSRQILEKFADAARSAWRDLLYWTVGDVNDCACPQVLGVVPPSGVLRGPSCFSAHPPECGTTNMA
jgi:hypothetical protein